jgi:adenine-specific DNA methylase
VWHGRLGHCKPVVRIYLTESGLQLGGGILMLPQPGDEEEEASRKREKPSIDSSLVCVWRPGGRGSVVDSVLRSVQVRKSRSRRRPRLQTSKGLLKIIRASPVLMLCERLAQCALG